MSCLSKLYGVIGNPLLRSSSPDLFNRFFKRNSMDSVYIPVEFGELQSKVILDAMRGTFSGFNVTSPFKRSILESCDILSNESIDTGSVNLVKVDDGEFMGSNTDPAGFKFLVDHNSIEISGKRILILGSGGAASSVRYALTSWFNADSVEVVTRNLASSLPGLVAYGEVRTHVDLIVSTIPYQHQSNFLPKFAMLIEKTSPSLLIDLVYNPVVSRFMSFARDRGVSSVGGGDMFLGQAREAVRSWFNMDADIELLRQLLDGLR